MPPSRPSPFAFDGPVAPAQVIDRDEETASLRAWAAAGRFVTLYAPRRYGKTSLLGKVAAEATRHDRMPTIIVDLYGLASVADLVVRLERAYRERATGPFRRAVEGVLRHARLGLSLGGAGISLTFAERPGTDPLPALHALLDLPTAVADRHDHRVLVVFDEFQSVLAVDGIEAIVRSHIQHQRAAASYIFAGSEPSLLDAMFADRTRPFYGQAEPFRLGRLPPGPLVDAIRRGFRSTQRSLGRVADLVVETADGHPQRAMLLAHCLWTATPEGQAADRDRFDQALGDVRRRTDRECEALWDRLTPNERRTVRAIVRYGSPFRRDAERMLELPKSSAQSAVDRLVRNGDLERGEPDGLRFVDPLFADWIARRFP